MKGSTCELLGAAALAAMMSVLGCRSLAAPPGPPKTQIETLFVPPDHPLSDCLRGDLGRSYRDQADGVLFFDRDSRIRVTPPSKSSATTYHVHLIHRVGDQNFEFVASQAESGRIDLDLSRFDQPEELIVASAARRISKESSGPVSSLAAGVGREEIITPPYVVSFRLLPAEGQIETLLSLQRHRYEIETDAGGTLTLVVGSLTRRDQLVTFYDPHRKSASLIAEDPYLYVPSQNGAVPPRLLVEVSDARSGDHPWQRAGTYHIPESADRLARTGTNPFVFRTSKRDLIAFGPPPRLDLMLPAEPPATSAIVRASVSGLEPSESVSFFLACAYPAGPEGGYAVRGQTFALSRLSPSLTTTCDLGHLDPSSFPLVASVAHRLVTPWRLTAGAWSPVPPAGKITVPLVPPAGDMTRYSKLLAPRYASHFDVLAFLGAGSGNKPGASLTDGFLGNNSAPDDPNVAPPPPSVFPTSPVGGPSGLLPLPSGGAGGMGNGGPDSKCGCGKNGSQCPNTLSPCKGTCGQGCPANGCCSPGDNVDGGNICITFPCPPKIKTCGMDEKDCKCPPHEWDGAAIRAAVEAAIQANGFLRNRFADLDGPNQAVGFAPCHTRTHAADVVAHFWKDQNIGIGGPRLGQWLVTYHVDVAFSPCKKQLKPGQFVMNDPQMPNILIDQHSANDSPIVVAPIGPGTSLNLGFVDPLTPIASTGSLSIDPNTLLNVALAVKALEVSVPVPAGSTTSLPADILRADLATLETVSSKAKAQSNAARLAWLLRAVTVLDGPDSWTLSLPPGQWAIYQSQAAGGTSTSTSTTTPPPPITPPSTPPSIPSSSVKRFGPRS